MKVTGDYKEVTLVPVQSTTERDETEKSPSAGGEESCTTDSKRTPPDALPQEVPLQNTPAHLSHVPLPPSEARTTLKPIVSQKHAEKAGPAQKIPQDEVMTRHGRSGTAIHHKQNARTASASSTHSQATPPAKKDSSHRKPPEETIHYSSIHRWEKEIDQKKTKREK